MLGGRSAEPGGGHPGAKLLEWRSWGGLPWRGAPGAAPLAVAINGWSQQAGVIWLAGLGSTTASRRGRKGPSEKTAHWRNDKKFCDAMAVGEGALLRRQMPCLTDATGSLSDRSQEGPTS